MKSESKGSNRLQQLVWVVAGVVVVSLLVAAASWLFSPSSGKTDAGKHKGVISERTVKDDSFRPESVVKEKSVNAPPAESGKAAVQEPVTVKSPVSKTAAPPPTSRNSEGKPPPSPKRTIPKRKVDVTGYALQMGAFGLKTNAEALKRRLKDHGFNATVLERERKFKVLIPGFKTKAEAEGARSKLDTAGFHGAFVVLQE